jgi:hypothetical protein
MMRRLIVLAVLAAGLLVFAGQASACSDLGFANNIQRANAKASYGTDLMQANLYRDATSAFSSALRMVINGQRPCSSALRNVRSTYTSALVDWRSGAQYLMRGNVTSGLRYFQRGTAKVKYATAQMKIWNASH